MLVVRLRDFGGKDGWDGMRCWCGISFRARGWDGERRLWGLWKENIQLTSFFGGRCLCFFLGCSARVLDGGICALMLFVGMDLFC